MRSDPARFYVLTEAPRSTGAAPPAEPGREATVGVGPVSLPGYLDRIQIVTRRGAQLEVAELDRRYRQLATAPRPPKDPREI